MRTICLLFVILCMVYDAFGDQLTPSTLDPNFSDAREKVFTPWCDPAQNAVVWRELASSNVPIYNERKDGGFSRDLYIPNPGLAYCAQGNLSEGALWRTERQKRKNGDEIVSASVYHDRSGATVYWALWVPRKSAYLVKEKMRELGINPAQVQLQ